MYRAERLGEDGWRWCRRERSSLAKATVHQVLTVIVGEGQQVQPHQHLSQVLIATTVLPGAMRHEDQGPEEAREGPISEANVRRVGGHFCVGLCRQEDQGQPWPPSELTVCFTSLQMIMRFTEAV